MKKLLISAIAVSLLLAACGGGGGAQDEVADLFIELAGEENLELDDDCVRDTAARLSDDDAQAIVDAGTDGDPVVSDEAEAIGDEIFSTCVNADSYVDLIVTSLAEDDDTIDADCMRAELSGLSVDEVDDKIFDAAFSCTTE